MKLFFHFIVVTLGFLLIVWGMLIFDVAEIRLTFSQIVYHIENSISLSDNSLDNGE